MFCQPNKSIQADVMGKAERLHLLQELHDSEHDFALIVTQSAGFHIRAQRNIQKKHKRTGMKQCIKSNR